MAGEFHDRRHPLRCDHRSHRPHAKPVRPYQVLHARGRVADQGYRVEVLRRASVLDLPRSGDDHRGQSQHDPGDGPPGRSREGGFDPRSRRRHDRRHAGRFRRRSAGNCCARPAAATRWRRAGWKGSPTSPAGSSPRITGPTSSSYRTGWEGPCGLICAAIPSFSGRRRCATSA